MTTPGAGNGVYVEVTEVGTQVTTAALLPSVAVEVFGVATPPPMTEVAVPGQSGPPGRRGIFVSSSPPTPADLQVGDIWLRPA